MARTLLLETSITHAGGGSGDDGGGGVFPFIGIYFLYPLGTLQPGATPPMPSHDILQCSALRHSQRVVVKCARISLENCNQVNFDIYIFTERKMAGN